LFQHEKPLIILLIYLHNNTSWRKRQIATLSARSTSGLLSLLNYLCCFAFLATHFFFYSKKEVSKKMPFPVTCPQKARVPENAS